MEAVISESLFEKWKSDFDMLNRNRVFILLFSDIILSLLINNNKNNDNNNNDNNNNNNSLVCLFRRRFIGRLHCSYMIKVQ